MKGMGDVQIKQVGAAGGSSVEQDELLGTRSGLFPQDRVNVCATKISASTLHVDRC